MINCNVQVEFSASQHITAITKFGRNHNEKMSKYYHKIILNRKKYDEI